jgi:hypothetical protein
MQEGWKFWVDVVIAIGTLAAVVVALFGEWLRARMFSPKLTLTLASPRGDPTPVTVTAPNGTSRVEQARYYRLRVSNQVPWPKATQTRVQLIRLEEPGPDGQLQLKWAGEVPLQWTNQQIVPLERTIGSSATCDLCSVVRGKWLELHPVIMPSNLEDLARRRTAANITVSLKVTSSEADSRIHRFQIDWDGRWSDGEIEMAQHLIIKPLQSESKATP